MNTRYLHTTTEIDRKECDKSSQKHDKANINNLVATSVKSKMEQIHILKRELNKHAAHVALKQNSSSRSKSSTK